MEKIGIALSGGGARGFGHLGVLKALEEHGIKPNIISGTSSGALIGAFYAAGYSVDDIIKISKSFQLFSWRSMLFGKSGFFSMESIEKLILKHIPSNSFEALKLPLTVNATDILNGKTIYYNSGEIAPALTASSCVPMIYQPIEYKSLYLADGGILNNLAIEPLEGNCDYLIGVEINSLSNKPEDLQIKNMLDRSFHLSICASIEQKAKRCNLFISPENMSKFGMFEFKRMDEIIEYTYKYTSHQLNK